MWSQQALTMTHGHGIGAGKRQRGEIEKLPSGSLRVRVYAGIDPVTGKKHHLTEVIPAGARADKLAEKARTRLLTQVDERRNPRTRATVNQMLDRHLEMLNVEATTLDSYEGFVRNHIRPLIGHVQVGWIDGEILDSFYRQLRTCRAHCRGKAFIEPDQPRARVRRALQAAHLPATRGRFPAQDSRDPEWCR
jgi:hypothetical protein